MINFIKRTISILFFVVIIFANMVLIHAEFPWVWIAIGIDIGLVVAALVMAIVMVYTAETDRSSHFGSSGFGSKPKDKKKKTTKRGKK